MIPKMYVLIRSDLDRPYQAVQAGHAVAEYLIRNPSCKWKNGTLVYLHVKNEEDLYKWGAKLDCKEIPYSVFVEPDIGNQKTALATVLLPEEHKIFKNLKLMK